MNNYLKILNSKEKKEIENNLKERFGVDKIPGILIQRGQERIFLYQGNFSEKQIQEIEQIIPVERLGTYFAKIQNNEIRLSLEGVQILKDQITKNIFEINQEQLNLWMHGSELNIKPKKLGFLIIKHKDYFLGCGKGSQEKISNFIPKTRRLKFKS